MRRKAFSALLLTTACARPVLYYPTPESVPVEFRVVDSTKLNGAGTHAAGTTAVATTPVALATARLVPSAGTAGTDLDYARARQIMMPVAGASTAHLTDSFDEPRDGERIHRAIDIPAPRGTPILAADDGVVLRMSSSPLGGITMYTADPQRRLVYYYAHMDRYHESMSPGRSLARGDTIGFVGTTGNAPKDLPHLHFQIMRMPEDGRYWDGQAINPYPLLGGGGSPR